jgi:dTDP-4-dehydrorhamnose reductase
VTLAAGGRVAATIGAMTAILVTGASGFLGSHVAARLAAEGHDVLAGFGGRAERVPQHARIEPIAIDLESDASLEAAFKKAWPEVVIHAAAISDLRACEAAPERARRCNVIASVKLARMAAALGSRFLFFSTDQVFDGEAEAYGEADPPRPIHEYGRGKADAEREIRRILPAATVLRVCLAYGTSPSRDRSASEKILLDLRAGRAPRLFADETRTPIAAEELASGVLAAIPERDLEVLNLAGAEPITRYEFGRRVASAFGFDPARIESATLEGADMMPRRPRRLVLESRRLRALLRIPAKSLDENLAREAAALRSGHEEDT